MTVHEFVLVVPMANVVTLNDRLNRRYDGARKIKVLRQIGRLAIRQHRVPALTGADLTVRIGWPNRQRRDAHNLVLTLKALIDGMVDADLLPDDDDAHLTGPDLRTYIARVPKSVVLTFTFTERPVAVVPEEPHS